MEIKVGTVEMTLDGVRTPKDYRECMKTITKGLLTLSGFQRTDEQELALSDNIHRFLLENAEFVVGIINAGKIKI